jgi:hypothetical protein
VKKEEKLAIMNKEREVYRPDLKYPVVPSRTLPRNISIKDCPTNIPLDTREGKVMLFNVGNPADITIDQSHLDDKGRPYIILQVRYYVGYPEDFINNDTGEVTEGTRYAFITVNGEVFKTSSGHAWQRVKALLELFSVAEWDEGISVRITERKSRNPQRQSPYHDIRIE